MNNVEFVKVKGTSRLSVAITVTFSDDTIKTLIVNEGDRVRNLTYVEGGCLYTITGDVKVINYTATASKTPITPSTCIHNTTSDFSKKVTSNSLVIDCSDTYKSDIRVVPIMNIRDFEGTPSSDLEITDVRFLSFKEVSFMSNNTPIAVLWNDEPVQVKQEDANVDVYTFTPPTVNRLNTLVVLDANSKVIEDIKGSEPKKLADTEITSAIRSSITAFIEKYFEKFTNELDVQVPDEEFYVKVADEVADAQELSMGGTTFTKSGSVYVNIGNNSFVNKPPFVVKDDGLYISPIVAQTLAGMDDRLVINVNGFDIDIKIIDNRPDVALEVTEYKAVGEKIGCIHSVEPILGAPILTYEESRQDGTSKVALQLSDPATGVMANSVVFVQKKNITDDVITYEIVSSDENGYVKLGHDYYNGIVKGVDEVDYEMKLTIGDTYHLDLGLKVVETIPEGRTVDIIIGDDAGADSKTITDGLPLAQDGDIVGLLAGTYEEDFNVSEGLTITGPTDDGEAIITGVVTADVDDSQLILEKLSYKNTTSPEGTGSSELEAKGNGISITGTSEVTLSDLKVQNNSNFSNVLSIKNTGVVRIKDSEFGNNDSYHVIDFGEDAKVANGTVIKNVKFGRNAGDVISMYDFEDEAVITIKDCDFDLSSNAIRISNVSNAKVTINIENVTYHATSVEPTTAGLIVFEDFTDNQDFSNVTVNFKNVGYQPEGGARVVFTGKTHETAGQLYYIKATSGEYEGGQPVTTFSE